MTNPQPVYSMEDKAEVAIEIAKYGSKDTNEIEDIAVTMLDLPYETLVFIRDLLDASKEVIP